MTNAQSRPEQVIGEAHNHDPVLINKQDVATIVNTQYFSLKPKIVWQGMATGWAWYPWAFGTK
jgi:hypothetical protein